MNLANKKCEPCHGSGSPIESLELEKYLANLQGWEVKKEGKEIQKQFKFKNFALALAFVNKVAQIAESEDHHPDVEFGWGYCKIKLSTHSIGGLHENDFIVAAKIEGIANV